MPDIFHERAIFDFYIMNENNLFGSRRIIYNNFTEHLLNAYNPNMSYPGLPYAWSDEDWCSEIKMLAGFGFNVYSFWLAPRLFFPNAVQQPFVKQYVRQIKVILEEAHRHDMKVEALLCVATMGDEWQTLCPNCPEQLKTILELWEMWADTLPDMDIWHIFPGDPGACSLNGCTANTYIDLSCQVANLLTKKLPDAEITVNTWGPPIFGWGIIEGPKGWKGEFLQDYQVSAWKHTPERTNECMSHLLKKLPDFPKGTCIAINLGFNPDSKPEGTADARAWAREIAKTNPIQTWDFSLTEGENCIAPHFRFKRLFQQRKREREAAPYRGGICYTMTPLLNILSLYEAAHSFINPDDDYMELAKDFYNKVFGENGSQIVEDLPLFEVIPDWGHYADLDISKQEFNQRMKLLASRLSSMDLRDFTPQIHIHPSPEYHRKELLFFADIMAAMSESSPDFDALSKQYKKHVYEIYEYLPSHVDPRPDLAMNKMITFFQNWKEDSSPTPGKWA